MEPTHRKISSYLTVWQKSVDLVADDYTATANFPQEEEVFGLTSQLGRSAVSVPSNVAEGQGLAITEEFIQFLSHARGFIV